MYSTAQSTDAAWETKIQFQFNYLDEFTHDS